MASFIEDYYWVVILIIMAVLGISAIAVWTLHHCRKKLRYDYSALVEESLLNDRLELDRKQQRDAVRSLAVINCQYYLRGSTRYTFISQLNELGSRVERNWFKVLDGNTKTERLMSLTPINFKSCPFKINASSQQALLELFLMLQHPYVYPILDFDFKMLSDQLFAIVVMPLNEKGTLKDLIYHSNCQDDWQDKYRYHGEGLELKQIQRLGRQVLEGLLFLQEKGYPPFCHLHSGNVIIQNGVARITALENPLLGHSPKIMTVAQKRLKDNKEGIDAVCFGHLLFEMSSGYELIRAHPSEKNYRDVSHLPQIVKVLKYIFDQDQRYPTIQELSCLDFFRNIDLRELRLSSTMPVFHNKVSPASKALLKDIRKQFKQRNKRSQSASAIETASISSRDSSESKSATRSKQRAVSGSQTLNTLSDLYSSLLPEHLTGASAKGGNERSSTPLQPLSTAPQTSQTPGSLKYPDLARAAGSSQITTGSQSNTSGSTEYYTPPDTPLLGRTSETEDLFATPLSHRERLLAEIKEKWKTKKMGEFDPLDV